MDMKMVFKKVKNEMEEASWKEGSQDSWWDRGSKATLGALSHPKCLWELPALFCPSAWKTPWNHL
ncbi:hypothetical protein EK904_009190 [Melospiza melodia maxima]|nr:hypothetical protein EK904_009190 [Melospiza melodia maxima]